MEKFNELIKSDKPVLIDFFATWCGPCKYMSPVLDKVKETVGEDARIVKIDVDQFQDLSMEYQIQTVPTFILFKNGEVLWRHSGVVQEKALTDIIKDHM